MKKTFVIFTVLFSVNALAYYTENIPNQCGAISSMVAVLTPNQYTCNSGEFLPAYSLGCETCPDDYTCSGGIYDFNENEYQGAIKSNTYITHNLTNMCSTNVPHALFATFTPNVHTCSAGYYLPANVDSCTICPAGNKCVGGTYTFNETTTQGIESCNGSFAPVGSSVCYEHILHVGNDIIYLSSTKRTTPSLNVELNENTFYANMTTTQTTMSANSQHYLKTIYNNEIYYVCDDTVCPQ